MYAFIDDFIDYTCARLVGRFTRRTNPPHPTASGTRVLSQQGTANFITSLDDTRSPKVTAFAFNISYGRHLAAEGERHSKPNPTAEAEYRRAAQHDQKRSREYLMKTRKRLQKVRRA